MTSFIKTVAAITLGLTASAAIAAPKQLITHNLTSVESNAFVAGTIPSQHPTHPHSDNKVMWAGVRLACFGHVTNGTCWAVIKMETDTANPVNLGTVTIDLESGDITPKQLTAYGYTLTVNGPGETTLTESTY